MPDWLIVVLIVISSLLLVGFLLFLIDGFIFFNLTFRRRIGDKDFAKNENPKEKNAPDRLWYFSNKIEELTLVSKDKLNLKGYFIKNPSNSNKLAILIHGYHGRYYSLVSQAKIFFELGYDVLSLNNRCHDTSEGKYFTMGKKEKEDVLLWISKMTKRNPDYKIALLGVSMGAHIAMQTAASPKLDKRVKCIIEDCGYFSLRKELLSILYQQHQFWPRCHVLAGEFVAKVFYHFDYHQSIDKAFKNLNIPIMLIHGEDDNYVPFENLKLNADAVPSNIYKEVHPFKGAKHTKSIEQYDLYKQIVKDFCGKFIDEN